ncbi:hypothetical protein LEP1GSC199_2059 [Leptospira vanthielii serovar Holland str. Waz Holland = ATCC 700522]|uniref:Uncharacterized protein n=1 Tax=Leptospira vanthielii serovar Holland str. Waz Holland = ATCC 700522 TaxID=1218591 RepID=N1WCM3_9LEPT|nr:hypothetical protein LEP1GSC199_2059 [Leptospira vanthielii serovar Holland str. Waz Holland = ATCC 700522]
MQNFPTPEPKSTSDVTLSRDRYFQVLSMTEIGVHWYAERIWNFWERQESHKASVIGSPTLNFFPLLKNWFLISLCYVTPFVYGPKDSVFEPNDRNH